MISFLTFYYMHDIVMWVIERFYFRWINSWNGQKMMFISWWVQNKKWSHEQTAWPSSTVCGFPLFELIQLVKEVDWHDEVLSQICRIFFNRHNCIVWNANIISHFKTLLNVKVVALFLSSDSLVYNHSIILDLQYTLVKSSILQMWNFLVFIGKIMLNSPFIDYWMFIENCRLLSILMLSTGVRYSGRFVQKSIIN